MWRTLYASLVIYGVIAWVLLALASCAPREKYRPCRTDFRDDRPECNQPDPCECVLPWAPWFDHCCLRQSQETLR